MIYKRAGRFRIRFFSTILTPVTISSKYSYRLNQVQFSIWGGALYIVNDGRQKSNMKKVEISIEKARYKIFNLWKTRFLSDNNLSNCDTIGSDATKATRSRNDRILGAKILPPPSSPRISFTLMSLTESLCSPLCYWTEVSFGVTRMSKYVIGHGPPITATRDESEISWNGRREYICKGKVSLIQKNDWLSIMTNAAAGSLRLPETPLPWRQVDFHV